MTSLRTRRLAAGFLAMLPLGVLLVCSMVLPISAPPMLGPVLAV